MSQSKDSLQDFIDRSAQLLAVAEFLARENAQLKARLAQSQTRAAGLEKRLSIARARVETLIARLPDNESSTLISGKQ